MTPLQYHTQDEDFLQMLRKLRENGKCAVTMSDIILQMWQCGVSYCTGGRVYEL